MRTLAALALLAAGLPLTACGASVAAAGPKVATRPDVALPVAAASGAPATGRCAADAAAELDAVARRIYRQSVDGRNVTASLHRLTTSAPLAAAVAADDPTAIRRLLPPLDKNQVVRQVITDRHGRVLERKGRTRSFAPQAGTLRDPQGRVVGHVLIAISPDAALVGIVHRVTGADVVLTAPGGRVVAATRPGTPAPPPGATRMRLRGRWVRVSSFASQAFPAGPLEVHVLVPPQPASLCAGSAAETRMNALAAVGKRLYAAEGRSGEVTRSLARAARLPLMRRAIADGDPAGVRSAVEVLFRDHRFHIVRVRAVDVEGRLIKDVGGPHALAPAWTPVRGPGGHVAGRLELSVQDDTGYIKLMQRFGRVGVVLHEGSRLVPGSTFRLAAGLPAAGGTTIHGHRFLVRSFSGPKFPSGALRVSLLRRVRRS